MIINADDFGLTPGVNRAIVELQNAGALNSTTLMATGACFTAAVHLAFAQPALSVGCHLVLVDGSPCLHPDQVPSLLDPLRPSSALLRPTVGSFLRDLLRGRIRHQEIEAEAIAQIRRMQAGGVTVSHIDSHKHLHAFPRALAPLLRAARHCEVKCVRNPFEPGWSLRATRTASGWRRLQIYAMKTQQRSWMRIAGDHGFAFPDGSIGVLATGILDQPLLRALLRAMPAGTWELVCHPGYRDQALEQVHTRLLASREVERDALLAVIPEVLRKNPELTLIDFHQFAMKEKYREKSRRDD